MTAPTERISPLSRADISPEELTMLRAAFPRASTYLDDRPDAPPMPPILGLLARHPSIAGGWLSYNGALLDGGVLDARTRELLILAVVRRAESSYLWQEHARIARTADVTDDEIQAIERRTSDSFAGRDRTLLQAVDELLDQQVVAHATWTSLAEHFDERELLEVLFVVGTYACLAMVLNSTGLAPPSGEQR